MELESVYAFSILWLLRKQFLIYFFFFYCTKSTKEEARKQMKVRVHQSFLGLGTTIHYFDKISPVHLQDCVLCGRQLNVCIIHEKYNYFL